MFLGIILKLYVHLGEICIFTMFFFIAKHFIAFVFHGKEFYFQCSSVYMSIQTPNLSLPSTLSPW